MEEKEQPSGINPATIAITSDTHKSSHFPMYGIINVNVELLT